MIIWSLSGLRIPLYLNKYLYYICITLFFVRGIRVLVAGTRASIGDVPLNVIEVDEGRAGYRSSRATCTSPFTVHIF